MLPLLCFHLSQQFSVMLEEGRAKESGEGRGRSVLMGVTTVLLAFLPIFLVIMLVVIAQRRAGKQ